MFDEYRISRANWLINVINHLMSSTPPYEIDGYPDRCKLTHDADDRSSVENSWQLIFRADNVEKCSRLSHRDKRIYLSLLLTAVSFLLE
ncbi:unnamed protein product [Microthlaspi erraticum]|uniref:Uncharacterized protein n=1 Tax=Microthlaspi erraticum TaxID=1685480 RepID=A0A6D2ICX2_9BRAS|nr:unnamed protein product [Microthlaspi erraticum]